MPEGMITEYWYDCPICKSNKYKGGNLTTLKKHLQSHSKDTLVNGILGYTSSNHLGYVKSYSVCSRR